MGKIREYLIGVKSELAKVEWPKAKEVVKLTLIVLFITIIVAAWVGGLDFGFAKALESLIKS